MRASETIQITLTAADGVSLSGQYWPAPGAWLAYAVGHGFTGSSQQRGVMAICRRLVGRGAGVLALDFRGHGSSGGLSMVGAVEELDLDAAVAFLRGAGYPRVVTAGWSMGGSVALRHAAGPGRATGEHDHSRPTSVDAVVSVSSPGLWFERGTRAMRRVHFAAETGLGRRLVGAAWRTRLDVGWSELPEAPVELVGRIAPKPVLLVHGDADAFFPLRHARALAAAAPGAELWIEAGMGHAEAATTPELVDRIDDWVRHKVGAVGPAAQPTGLPSVGRGS
jgi:uncharacterized protein